LFLFTGPVGVGIYAAGYKPIRRLEDLSKQFVISIYPLFSKFAKKSKKKLSIIYRKSLAYFTIYNILVIGILILFAKPIILTLYTKEFLNSITIFQLLAVGSFFYIINTLATIFLFAVKKVSYNNYVGVIGVSINLLLNLILIPKYSYYGAALSTIATFFVIFAIKLLYIKFYNKK